MALIEDKPGREDGTGRTSTAAHGLLRRHPMPVKRSLALVVFALPSLSLQAAPGRAAEKPWCATGERRAANAVVAHREAEARGVRARSAAQQSADVGQIAILQDEGDLALLRRPMNLQGAGIRFSP